MRRPLVLTVSALAIPMVIGISATLRSRDGGDEPPASLALATRQPTEPDDLGPMPELVGGTHWINSAPISRAQLAGKVVMVEIWTYGCYNCLNALPHIKETAAKYKAAGLITIGVHTPEFDREKVVATVERKVRELGVEFPVVMDNDFAIWRAFNNRYWPAVYIIDKKGRIRFHHDGEGRYDNIDATVNLLLAER
jgi:thiol-disulfide isomerase/thioredoxin